MGPLKRYILSKADASLDRLSTLALVVTLADMTMMWFAFAWSRGRSPDEIYPVPEAMMYLLWMTLVVYVAPKEVTRWKHPKGYKSKRYGQVFGVIWAISLLSMGMAQFFTEGYYLVPKGMWPTTLGALTIFVVSGISKSMHECKNGNCDPEDAGEEPGSEKPTEESAEDKDTT